MNERRPSVLDPYTFFGLPQSASAQQIEAAYRQQNEYWRHLATVPERAREAQEMLDKLADAYAAAMQGTEREGGLEYRETIAPSGFVSGVSPAEKDRCPHCGSRENPSDARFCLACGKELFQLCPNPRCRTELPWHYARCHRCGISIAEFVEQQRVETRQRKLVEIETKQRRLVEIEDDRRLAQSRAIFLHSQRGPRERLTALANNGYGGCLRNVLGLLLFLPVWAVVLSRAIINGIVVYYAHLSQPAEVASTLVALLWFWGSPLIWIWVFARLDFYRSVQRPAQAALDTEEERLKREIRELELQV
jgi:hypothetical protein